MFRDLLNNKPLTGLLLSAYLTGGLMGCASMGTPGGGLYDETPPELKSMDPEEGALGVKKSEITLRFNENIKLDKIMEKMTVSPPQEKAPIVLSNAKTMTIELLDSLRPNTTYSFDLGNAVQDNNEGNPMENLSFSFSTGDHIDSLQINGYLLNAEDLEPITGAYVGIYNDTTLEGDSVFVKRAFERAGKTGDLGQFSIKGIAPGTYRLYALLDGNTNYRYDLTTENIAFLDSLVVPSMQKRLVHDTIWADSVTIDTITTSGTIDYFPSDIVLRMFNEGRYNRYLDNCERPDSTKIAVRFSAPMPELPSFRLLKHVHNGEELLVEADSSAGSADQWMIAEPNPTLDTLTFWLKDSTVFLRDTLLVSMSYVFTDTTGLDTIRTDTIQLPKPIVKKETEKKEEKKDKRKRARRRGQKDDENESESDSLPVINYMTLKIVGSTSIHIGQKPQFESSAPLDSCILEGLKLERQKDSLWVEMPFKWNSEPTHIRRYTLLGEPYFSPGETYRLTVDSAAMYDIYGNPIAKTSITFQEKKVEDYAHLLFNITGIDEPAFVQIVNEKDVPVQQAPVENGKAKFVNILPGKVYARLVVDTNNNGIFDAGNLEQRRQPEQVYYFNAELQLRANWSIEQHWNPTLLPLETQKPEDVKINKPKEEKEKKSKNAEYYEKMGITPPQTQTGTTTNTNKNARMKTVR